MKKPEESLPEFAKALELASDRIPEQKPQVQNFIATALMDLGRYQEAEPYLADSMRTNSTMFYETARINLAICQFEQGNLQRAKQILEPAIYSKSEIKVEKVADANVLYSLVL